MSKEEYLSKFNEGIYSDPVEYSYCRESVQLHLQPLFRLNKIEILLYLFNNMYHLFNYQLLVCAPELWMDLRKADWDAIHLNTRREYGRLDLIDDPHAFDDVMFLFKYIRVDVFKSIYENDKISAADKITIFDAMHGFTYDSELDEYDLMNIEDGTWASMDIFEAARTRLIADGMSPKNESSDEVRKQLQSYIASLENDPV